MIDRPIRADAQRNRERLLEVALQAFSESGAEASLEAIAKSAGVGIGTLYRHFPTRRAIIEAVYRNELARLCDSVDELLAAHSPDAALSAWMERFINYIKTKRGMADALNSVLTCDGKAYEQSRLLVLAAMTRLMQSAVAAGKIRADVAPLDVLASVASFSFSDTTPEQRTRMVNLLMDGLRFRA